MPNAKRQLIITPDIVEIMIQQLAEAEFNKGYLFPVWFINLKPQAPATATTVKGAPIAAIIIVRQDQTAVWTAASIPVAPLLTQGLELLLIILQIMWTQMFLILLQIQVVGAVLSLVHTLEVIAAACLV